MKKFLLIGAAILIAGAATAAVAADPKGSKMHAPAAAAPARMTKTAPPRSATAQHPGKRHPGYRTHHRHHHTKK